MLTNKQKKTIELVHNLVHNILLPISNTHNYTDKICWSMFKFKLCDKWSFRALKPPGWKSEWHCGVRVASNKKLVGFISAIPAHIRVYEQ